MKKYFEVFRLSFKMQIVWRFDVFMTMIATISRIVAAWILWQAIFSRHGLVGSFTLESMLSYYILSSIFASIDFSHQISGEISYLIRNGRFSGHMVTPVNPLFFFGAMTAGESAFHAGFSLLAAVLCAIVFRISVIIASGPERIFLALALIPAGFMFMSCYHYLVGILAFRYPEIDFFLHIQSNIIAFATGALVPLSLLPDAALAFFRFLPFTHVVYTPVMLLCGQIDAKEGLSGLVILSVWTACMLPVTQRMYNFLRVRYDGVGI